MKTKDLIYCLSSLLLLLGCKQQQVEEKEVLRPVRYQEISQHDTALPKTFTGLAKPGMKSRLSFKVPGTISRLNVKIGQQVNRGSLIAAIDHSDYELQYEEADAGVKNADAQEKSAKSNYERIRLLYENQNVSLAEFESAKSAFNSAKAQEKAVKQRRKLAKAQLSYTRLRSPAAGVIAEVRVEENENVSAGQPVVVITSERQMEVEMTVPDLYISAIKVGDPVQVVFSAVKNQKFKGAVSEVGFAADYQTTYPVVIKLEKSDPSIRPGMSAEVEINLAGELKADKFYVPAISVQEDTEGRFVFLVTPNDSGSGTIVKKDIRTGELSTYGLEIIEGIGVGDLVVTSGMSMMEDGMKVKLLN